MARDLEALVRDGYDAINARDIDRALERVDPDVVLHSQFASVTGRPYEGHDGIRRWFADTEETWASLTQTVKRVIPVDDDRAIALVHFRGTGKRSDVELDSEFAVLIEFRGEKSVRVEIRESVEQALEAAGLDSEPGG